MVEKPYQPRMIETLPAKKLVRLLEYLQNTGLDPQRIALQAGLNLDELFKSRSAKEAPSLYYSLLYNEAVAELERTGRHIPWAAGLGSSFFKMMCYSLISCKTLGDSVQRAESFNRLTFPLAGQQVELREVDHKTAAISYDVDESFVKRSLSPNNWELQGCLTVARSSGIEMWMGLCGWLIGRKITPISVSVAGSMPNEAYKARTSEVFACPIEFNADTTSIKIPLELLDLRIVHGPESLEEFLATGPYQLWSTEDKLVSTSAAIKSLLGNDFSDGIASFEQMAENMHTSASTLRRHLLAEGSSYQKIKDERRRDIAVEMLCTSNTKISDISYQVGFSDTSSFVRSFRAWTGVTPKCYRDSAKPTHILS